MRVFVQWRLQLVAAMQRQFISAIAKGILMASMTAILRKLRTEIVRQHEKCIRTSEYCIDSPSRKYILCWVYLLYFITKKPFELW